MVVRAIALFGCEFFLSYGMTECCGKISISILPRDRAGMPGGQGDVGGTPRQAPSGQRVPCTAQPAHMPPFDPLCRVVPWLHQPRLITVRPAPSLPPPLAPPRQSRSSWSW